MSKVVVVERFECPGADNDCPQEGYEIVESTVPGFHMGEMLVSIEPLKRSGFTVEVTTEEEPPTPEDFCDDDAPPF